MHKWVFILLFLISPFSFSSPAALFSAKEVMNKKSLTDLEIDKIEKSIRYLEDRQHFASLKKQRRFFDSPQWKVEGIFNTLILTYYNKPLINLSFNDAAESALINGHTIKINDSKPIWVQVKKLFEKESSAAYFYSLLLETAYAESSSLFDIKKFIIFSLLNRNASQESLKKDFTNNLVELTELNGVKMNASEPITCSNGKVSGKLVASIHRKELYSDDTEPGQRKLNTFEKKIQVSVDFTSNFSAANQLELNVQLGSAKTHFMVNAKKFETLNKDACLIKKLEKSPKDQSLRIKKEFIKDYKNDESMNTLMGNLNLSLDPEGSVVQDFHTCFVFKGKNWTNSKDLLKAEDYIDCLTQICEKKFDAAFLDFNDIPQVEFSQEGKLNPKDETLIKKLSDEKIQSHKTLLAELEKRLLPSKNYDCDTMSSKCYITNSILDQETNSTLKKAYEDFKYALRGHAWAMDPIEEAVVATRDIVVAATACCLDSQCRENFKMRRKDPTSPATHPEVPGTQ